MGADSLTIRDYPVQAYDALTLRLANMDTVRTVKLITTSLAFASLGLTALVSAAFAGKMDALVGDWDLNIAKSKFEPSPPMKKYTMKVIDAGADHLLIKSDWIEADGTAGHVEYSTAFDGKPIPIIDYPIADTVTDTVVNATTWKSVWTKNGKIVERELETISADGKTFREIDQGKDEKGRKYKNHLVFERP
jgi:hypothetical protein